MERLITKEIIKWKNDRDNFPLFILGARQIGKTFIVKEFAKNTYKNKYIYINFMDKDKYFNYLNGETNPEKILNIIEGISNRKIDENWLLIFDEIQEIPSLKTSLKIFVDKNIKIKIICLGSYLGNSLNDKNSFPVGKIKTLNMFPLNFEEFLMAKNRKDLIEYIKNLLINKNEVDDIKHELLMDLLYEFWFVGGMPKVLDTYLKKHDLSICNEIKRELINGYKNDIIKYVEGNSNKLKSQSIYEKIPFFLAKQNKKFKLAQIDSNARYLTYEDAIQSLLITKIIYKINNLNSFNAPLKLNKKESEFKIYYNDCGFISTIFNLNKELFLKNEEGYSNIKGAIAENFILSELMQKINDQNLAYYSFRDKNKNNYEIDFVIENSNGNLVPIEVKSGKTIKTKSINKLIEIENKKIKKSIIVSAKNLKIINNDLIIPLYAIGFLDIFDNRLKD